MNRKFFIFLFIFYFYFFFVESVSASVVINEVMPHTNNSWGDEWIELYNPSNNELNLSGWKIGDRNDNDTIKSLIIHGQSFALIVDSNASNNTGCKAFNISDESCIEFPAIGNGLSDSNESVFLYDEFGVLNDSFSWTTNIKSSGSSWGRNDSGWTFCIPTPGAQNNCSEQQQEKSLELSYQSEVQCNENFTITIKVLNFEPGSYDVKIDIKDVVTDNRVAKVWNGTKWISTAYYVNDVLKVDENGTGQATIIFKVEAFSGEAYLEPKIRDVGTFDQDYSILVTCSDQSTQTESEITIINAPDSAKFGETIEVKLNVYKGDTTKYAVYVYVEDDDGNKVSDKITLYFYTKFSNQTAEVELQLKCKNESGYYEIVVEGLDAGDRKKIKIDSCSSSESDDSENSGEGITIGDFTYSLTVPNSISIGEQFKIKLKITSKAEQEQNFLVWSYVYRGSKCYSCSNGTRESNAKSVVVEPNSTAEVELQNVVESAEPGNYKLKIKVLQEGLKTPKEFSYDLKVESSKSSENLQKTNKSIANNATSNADNEVSNAITPNAITSNTIVNSKSFSFRKALPYVLATVCALLAIYIIIKKI